MGSVCKLSQLCHRTKMKAFIVSALLGLAAAAPTPDVSSHAHVSHGGVVLASHASHAPHLGHLGHAVHAPVHHAVHPVAHHAVHPVAHHAVHPVAHHAVVAPVVHHAPVVAHAVHAAPVVAPVVVKAAPAYAPAPVAYKPAPAYKAEEYPDEVSPYTFTYAVADDYSKANFNAEETSDGASNVQGGYSVALPDGRIQHVKYSSNGYDGYVADVTYEGTAVYPEAKPYAAPAPAYHA